MDEMALLTEHISHWHSSFSYVRATLLFDWVQFMHESMSYPGTSRQGAGLIDLLRKVDSLAPQPSEVGAGHALGPAAATLFERIDPM